MPGSTVSFASRACDRTWFLRSGAINIDIAEELSAEYNAMPARKDVSLDLAVKIDLAAISGYIAVDNRVSCKGNSTLRKQ